MPNENSELDSMLQAAGAAAGSEMVQDLATAALEDISESLAEVDGEGEEEKVYTVVGELRKLNATLVELLDLLKKQM